MTRHTTYRSHRRGLPSSTYYFLGQSVYIIFSVQDTTPAKMLRELSVLVSVLMVKSIVQVEAADYGKSWKH